MGAFVGSLVLWGLGMLLAPAINSAVSFSLDSSDGKKLASFGARFREYVTSKQYGVFLLGAVAWALTVAACYALFSPKPQLPAPGVRARYEFIVSNCRIPQSEQSDVTVALQEKGFSGKIAVNNTNKPVEATAAGRTVFFYQSTNREAAQAIANLLEDKTGQTYSVTHGDGFRVPQRKFANIFVIHNIDGSCERS